MYGNGCRLPATSRMASSQSVADVIPAEQRPCVATSLSADRLGKGRRAGQGVEHRDVLVAASVPEPACGRRELPTRTGETAFASVGGRASRPSIWASERLSYGDGQTTSVGACERVVLRLLGNEAEPVQPRLGGKRQRAAAHEHEVEPVGMARAVAAMVLDEVDDALRPVESADVEGVPPLDPVLGDEARGVGVASSSTPAPTTRARSSATPKRRWASSSSSGVLKSSRRARRRPRRRPGGERRLRVFDEVFARPACPVEHPRGVRAGRSAASASERARGSSARASTNSAAPTPNVSPTRAGDRAALRALCRSPEPQRGSWTSSSTCQVPPRRPEGSTSCSWAAGRCRFRPSLGFRVGFVPEQAKQMR